MSEANQSDTWCGAWTPLSEAKGINLFMNVWWY